MPAQIDLGSNDEFGKAVDIEGTTLVVGAEVYSPSEGEPNSGAAFVYEYASGEWAYAGTELFDPDGDTLFYFGHDVAISGNWIVCGSRGDDALGANAGSAHIFKKVSGEWEYSQTIRGNDTNAQDFFGHAVEISGSTAIVGRG
jgi:hypothetical protein